MRAIEFLLEYRREDEERRIISAKNYANRKESDPDFSLDRLEAVDPSLGKKYVPVLANWWIRGNNIAELEKDNLVKDLLQLYTEIKPKNLDLGSINLYEFIDIMNAYRGDFKEIYRDNELRVVRVLDETAAKFWGRKTDWCTAKKEDNKFNYYKQRGPLFVIIYGKQKFQFWFDKIFNERIEFNNSDNITENPRKLPFFKKLQMIFHKICDNILFNPNPTEQEQLDAIAEDGDNIKFIENPSYNVQKRAVERSGNAISYIPNPDPEIQEISVRRRPESLINIEHPTEKVQIIAVSDSPWLIKTLINKGIKVSEQVQKAAVTTDGRLIADLYERGIQPSKAVQLAAVAADIDALPYIVYYQESVDEEVQLAAANRHGNIVWALYSKGNRPSKAVKLAALLRYPDSLQNIYINGDDIDEETQLALVKKHPGSLYKIRNPGPILQKLLDERSIKSTGYSDDDLYN